MTGRCVQTRRTRTAGKADIPSVDDHVSKLEHMGKETVKKLGDVHDAARTAGISDFVLPGFPPSGVVAIDKVGGFRRLAIIAEQDTHLRQRLQQILKLSKEKWDEARDHAMKAVVVDNRMRIWWHTDLPQGNHFPRTGAVPPRAPLHRPRPCLHPCRTACRPRCLLPGGEYRYAHPHRATHGVQLPAQYTSYGRACACCTQ